MPAFIRIPLAMLLIAINTLLHGTVLFVLTTFKLVLPVASVRRGLSHALAAIAESWIGFNSWAIDVFARIRWHVSGLEGLQRDRNYLVLCNHQSWVDIPVLQKLLNRRIPLMRFFLKSQLIWVPILGPAWWALDFPFMKRYSKQQLAAHPELMGRDREVTRRACAKFRQMPVSVMNFVEGTRFTQAKHDAQQSPYRHLLKPRAGGVAFVLDSMGEALHTILDVTIVYPRRGVSMLDLFAGRIHDVRVHFRQMPVTRELAGDYENDAAFRARFQQWVNALWHEKDAQIQQLLEAAQIAHSLR